MVRYAWTFVGTPYHWGGEDPIEGMDCSGLIGEVGSGVGVLPHGYRARARDIIDRFKHLAVPETAVHGTPGLFLGWGNPITHIAVTIGHGLLIDASGGDSRTTSDAVAAEMDAFVKVRPVGYRGPWRIAVDPFSSL